MIMRRDFESDRRYQSWEKRTKTKREKNDDAENWTGRSPRLYKQRQNIFCWTGKSSDFALGDFVLWDCPVQKSDRVIYYISTIFFIVSNEHFLIIFGSNFPKCSFYLAPVCPPLFLINYHFSHVRKE